MEMAVPGHTHNDADAIFGSFSSRMKERDVYEPEDVYALFA